MRTRPLVLPDCIKQKNPYRLEVSSNNRQGQGENKLRRLERNVNSVLSSATTFSESDLQGICTPDRLHDDGDLQLGRCIHDNLDASQVSLRVVISCWAIHPTKKHLHGYSTGANYCAKPYKKREVWESNPRLTTLQVLMPAPPPYCRSCDLTLPQVHGGTSRYKNWCAVATPHKS